MTYLRGDVRKERDDLKTFSKEGARVKCQKKYFNEYKD